MHTKNAEKIIKTLSEKGFLRFKSAKKIFEAVIILEDLDLDYIEDD